jgi:hypothetical protein
MPYSISDYSFQQAKKLGVEIKSSKNPKKKIDVFKQGKKITTIGASGYNDYPTYMKQDKELANQKKILYKKRHEKDRHIKGTAGFYADKILW